MTQTLKPRQPLRDGSIIDTLQVALADDLEAVEALLIARAASPVAMIPDMSGYIVGAGGKRLRPMVTLAAAHAAGGATPATHALATAVEFIHTAT
ncbi:MAG: polyprenyl synthetase family protein, partial [Pseudomonadota bacterium]